ncbi:MAG TPA: PP2C family protein-serine/threonine phosphatase [Polyangiaceae bacterium]|nr:PP2C family protein-serine/threonine phosphatase [Polyangiaceae bacterium]
MTTRVSRNSLPSIEARADELFRERYTASAKRTDRLFAYLMIGQWLAGIAVALFLSPYGWEGKTRSVHLHVPLAVFLGAAISSLPLLLIATSPGTTWTRHTVAVAQMLWSALLIHLSGGRIETHFHVFGSLAFLAFYRDWRVIVTASAVVALDHLLRQLVYPESVYGVLSPETWRFLEHTFWVVFEDVFLVIFAIGSVREMRSVARQQARIELSEQLEKEMEIASRIQSAILPTRTSVSGLEIAARMIPASEVGGDYYDVLPVPGDGCWLGIGDVAGHGLTAGLVMLQAQSAIKALVLQDGERLPSELLAAVNQVLFDNVRQRMGQEEHMTMTLIRYHQDGRLIVAGAHQSIVICRAASGRCERHSSQGTWLGLVADVSTFNEDRSFRLQEGDLLVLYTDGMTEAMSSAHEQFGVERLCAVVERMHDSPPELVRDQLLDSLAAWSSAPHSDDVTLLVLRHLGGTDTRATSGIQRRSQRLEAVS